MGRKIKPKKPTRDIELEAEKSEALKYEAAEPWKKRLQEMIIIRKSNPRRVSIAAGLNPTTVNQLLKSPRSPSIDTILAIANALGVTVHWLLTGKDPETGASNAGDARADVLQKVPVLAWPSVLAWTDHIGDAQVLRYDTAERIDPPTARFRLEMSGSSMAPLLDDGTILDCSGAMLPEPEDVVIAYVSKQRQCVARKLIPRTYSEEGRPVTGALVATNAAWPELAFDVTKGDRIIAVVFDAIRPLRRAGRLRIR